MKCFKGFVQNSRINLFRKRISWSGCRAKLNLKHYLPMLQAAFTHVRGSFLDFFSTKFFLPFRGHNPLYSASWTHEFGHPTMYCCRWCSHQPHHTATTRTRVVQKVIVYLMSRSHETQISSCWLLNGWWTKSCSFLGGQLDFVHQQYRFCFSLCSQIGIVETAKMLEQQPVTLTYSSINDFLRFRILDDLSFSRKASDEFGQSSHWSSHVRLQKMGSDKKGRAEQT